MELERRARAFENQMRFDDARDAFDAALRLNPSSQSCVEGRARIALQLHEEKAVGLCARALAFHDHDPDLQFQMIHIAALELGSEAIPLLETYVGRHPRDARAQDLLADLRAQAGAGDSFADGYLDALAQQPNDPALLISYWNILSHSGRHQQALESMDAHRALFEGDREFLMLEIAIAAHAGLIERSGELVERLDDRPDAQLARGQHQLQTGRPDEAARFLEAVTTAEPDNFTAWSLLEAAWRLTGDSRHHWLVGQPGLFGPVDLDLTAEQLAETASVLQPLHRARVQPIGQSVRGGTQTTGDLFTRHGSQFPAFIAALAEGIRKFHAGLPPADPRHPLLKYRDEGISFGPSWSVRLTGGGHHAAHFHPGGILSSACYISLPEELGDERDQSGWLEIGRPPGELGLDLPPLATIKPKPGRLVLFPSFLFHGTRPFGAGERLTVAFDLVPVPA